MNTTLDYLTLSLRLPDVAPVEGPPPPVTKDLIRKALGKMKCIKAAGPSGINAEMLKAAGEVGIELLTELTEVIFCNELHIEPLNLSGAGKLSGSENHGSDYEVARECARLLHTRDSGHRLHAVWLCAGSRHH